MELSIDLLLHRIASELREMSAQTGQIEAIVASRLTGAKPPPDAREMMQELDRIRQTQAALAATLDTIANGAASHGKVSAETLANGSILPSVTQRLIDGRSLRQARMDQREPEIW